MSTNVHMSSSATALGRLIVIVFALSAIAVGALAWSHGVWAGACVVAGGALLARLAWLAVKDAARHRAPRVHRQPTPELRHRARRRARLGFLFWFAVVLSACWTLLGQTGDWEWWRYALAMLAAFGGAWRARGHIDTLEENR